MPRLPFTVDSALLRELGERLIGKPHVALAELVKNSYDADATEVHIRFEEDRIEVRDNGHGMSFDEFKNHWMRIGTTHKSGQRTSRNLGRPMTGSKGVGRLAVQFLAKELTLRTVSERDTTSQLDVDVNWEQAVQVGTLTEATADCHRVSRTASFPSGCRHGTAVILCDLKHEWKEEKVNEEKTKKEKITDLAREIWWLQPPFRMNPRLVADRQRAFHVRFMSAEKDLGAKFSAQMKAIKDIWHARLVGKLCSSGGSKGSTGHEVKLSLEFSDGTNEVTTYPLANPELHEAEFEIRIYHLLHRQPRGIKVGEARDYLNRHGGVHVYDAGFHLPYYGIDNDWLEIERDHAHRVTRSRLLPEDLQVFPMSGYLPTQSRIVGVVHVDTARERELAIQEGKEVEERHLKIQITRDRLVDNEAYRALHDCVRGALEFYAIREAGRAYESAQKLRAIEPLRQKFLRVEDVLKEHQAEIPTPLFATLRKEVDEAVEASETEAEATVRKIALLGPLATAGISAIALQHELNQQFRLLEDAIEQLSTIRVSDSGTQGRLEHVADALVGWLGRARGTRALFSHLTEQENRETRARLLARNVLGDVVDQMNLFVRGAVFDTAGVDPNLRFPKARFAEWSAVFQNVFLNAVNAMMDSEERRVHVRSRGRGLTRAVLVQDTGCGVDLDIAESLFEPFERRLKLSPERRALALGGTGLGLTIVRMIAQNVGCKVSFVQPDDGFATAFRLSWSEKE